MTIALAVTGGVISKRRCPAASYCNIVRLAPSLRQPVRVATIVEVGDSGKRRLFQVRAGGFSRSIVRLGAQARHQRSVKQNPDGCVDSVAHSAENRR